MHKSTGEIQHVLHMIGVQYVRRWIDNGSSSWTCCQIFESVSELWICVIAHVRISDEFLERLYTAYRRIAAQGIGNPLDAGTLVRLLIDQATFAAIQRALDTARRQGGTVFFGGRVLEATSLHAYYTTPALVQGPTQVGIVCTEPFAPILSVLPYTTLDEAITIHNTVPQGLLEECSREQRWSQTLHERSTQRDEHERR